MSLCKFCGMDDFGNNNCVVCNEQFGSTCEEKWWKMFWGDYYGKCLNCILKDPTVKAKPICAHRTHVIGVKCRYCF